MKIAIITFHRAINYGAVLQTYALSNYLQSCGHEVEVLDYRSVAIENSYRIKISLDMYSIKRLLLKPAVDYKKQKFYSFINRYIPHTKPLYSFYDLQKISDSYDYVITGSDQVWNSQWTNCDNAYFLDFCEDTQKISYAASIGKTVISDQEAEQLKNSLLGFRHISVREKSAKELLENYISNPISINCDPVALLRKEQWQSIAQFPKDSHYVLVYMLVPSSNLMQQAINYGKQTGKKVFLISDNIRKQYQAEYRRFLSPRQFVGLFSNADCVFTNSFHGTMFSVVFEKELYIELQKYVGAPNSRLTDAVRALGLEKCIISNDIWYSGERPEYKDVKHIIERMQEETKEYFEKCFCEKEG